MPLLNDQAWYKQDGASESALRNLRETVGVDLPDEYIQLLAYSNEGEGELPAPFHTLCLDSAVVAADPGMLKVSAENYPGLVVFGSDGGGELFAFDTRGVYPWPIVAFDGVDPFGSLTVVADSFGSLIPMIGSAAA